MAVQGLVTLTVCRARADRNTAEVDLGACRGVLQHGVASGPFWETRELSHSPTLNTGTSVYASISYDGWSRVSTPFSQVGRQKEVEVKGFGNVLQVTLPPAGLLPTCLTAKGETVCQNRFSIE